MTRAADPMPSPSEPSFDRGHLDAGHGHRIHYEQCGNPAGRAVLLIHGGPGSASSPAQRRFYDPAAYRIVQFDQRGCGRSQPLGETRHNHTGALIADIERLRTHLGIERWLVSGGSWGAALALAYAGSHRGRVDGLLLRGLFLTGRADLEWFFGGAGAIFPERWRAFVELAPRSRRRSFQSWLWKLFTGGEPALQCRVALAWQAWECELGGGPAPPPPDAEGLENLRQRYRLQAHYLARECFLGEAAVLGHASRLHGLPVLWVHGRRDLVCRPANSWRAWRSLSGSRLWWVADGGHDPFSPALAAALGEAAARFAERGDFDGIGEVSGVDRPGRRSRD